MENKNNPGQDQDFTSKGRTSKENNEQEPTATPESDISGMDQQEGELNHGTTGNDPDLFTNGKSGASPE